MLLRQIKDGRSGSLIIAIKNIIWCEKEQKLLPFIIFMVKIFNNLNDSICQNDDSHNSSKTDYIGFKDYKDRSTHLF